MTHCDSCTDESTCDACASGYNYVTEVDKNYCEYVEPTVVCSNNCDTCTTVTDCTVCVAGYLLENGECNADMTCTVG